MAIRFSGLVQWPSPGRSWCTLVALSVLSGIALAQSPSPNQPMSIRTDRSLPPAPCPLIVPVALPALQPLRIAPAQVARKNRRGCLSPADAVYGPDGCPLKLCGEGGAIALPAAGPGGY